ncbi:MAG: hypothetical protein J6A01_02315 [Proteobacteria bacterium]|nr:hypothetical protein [Pseudomonadota bacterium]
MDATVQTVQNMLNALDADDFRTAMRFIQFLQETKKEKTAARNLAVFHQLQNMFEDDKGGYTSEEDIIRDLAQFRRERINHEDHAGH